MNSFHFREFNVVKKTCQTHIRKLLACLDTSVEVFRLRYLLYSVAAVSFSQLHTWPEIPV